MKKLLKEIAPYVNLYRDDKTGIAWVEDGSTGCGHSCHSNISATGSVRGMKKLGYWKKDARTVRTHGFIYNIDTILVSDEYDKIAAEYCQCIACIERRVLKSPSGLENCVLEEHKAKTFPWKDENLNLPSIGALVLVDYDEPRYGTVIAVSWHCFLFCSRRRSSGDYG